MPSCCVRCCKNSSIAQNKAAGITFHKFPRDFVWQQKWLDVIRASRNEETWIPSPFSVVCSIHFADEDLYKTKFGLRRIKKNAIPKQYLTRPKIDNDVPKEESVLSSSNTESQYQIVEVKLEPCNPEAHYADQNSTDVKIDPPLMPEPIFEIKNEPRNLSPETYHADNKSSEVQFEPSYTVQELITVKVEPFSPDTNNFEKSVNEILIEPITTQEVFLVKIEPDSLVTTNKNTNIQPVDISMQEENLRCATLSVHDSDIDSIYDSPLEYQLKRQLRKQKKLGEIRRKKIKLLNQQLRRLENTNNRLHETIKMLTEKLQAFQTVHMFQGSHSLWEAKTEGADLLNN